MRPIELIIVRAAELVREKIEELVVTLSPLNFNAETLQGACGISSRVLHRVLRRLGVQNDFVMGVYVDAWQEEGKDNHCWVEIPRLDVIVDVTATQFGILDKIYVTEPKFPYIETCRNATATRRLARWGGQSHVWYEGRLKRIEDYVAYTCQRERRMWEAAQVA